MRGVLSKTTIGLAHLLCLLVDAFVLQPGAAPHRSSSLIPRNSVAVERPEVSVSTGLTQTAPQQVLKQDPRVQNGATTVPASLPLNHVDFLASGTASQSTLWKTDSAKYDTGVLPLSPPADSFGAFKTGIPLSAENETNLRAARGFATANGSPYAPKQTTTYWKTSSTLYSDANLDVAPPADAFGTFRSGVPLSAEIDTNRRRAQSFSKA